MEPKEDIRDEPPTSEGKFEDWLPELRMQIPPSPPENDEVGPSTRQSPPTRQSEELQSEYEIQTTTIEMLRWHIMRPLTKGQLAIAAQLQVISYFF